MSISTQDGNPQSAWMSWSSGKDSAFALLELKKNPQVEVTALLTTVNETFERVAMHAVREVLLERQAAELGLPLVKINLPENCSNELYAERMGAVVQRAKAEGISAMVFGDLFLEDIRAYREGLLKESGIEPIFPLWNRPTHSLAREMIASGQKAIITCIDPKKLPPEFAGRFFDLEFLRDLPEGVDPCGENGEFHSFVFESPLYKRPIRIKPGAVVERGGFVFSDVLLAE